MILISETDVDMLIEKKCGNNYDSSSIHEQFLENFKEILKFLFTIFPLDLWVSDPLHQTRRPQRSHSNAGCAAAVATRPAQAPPWPLDVQEGHR